MTYNGYKNYETWCVNLWIGDSESMYHYAQELTRRAKDTYTLAQQLKDWIEEENPLSEKATLYSDLLGAAIREVDWTQIAELWWEDFRDDEDEEEKEEPEEDEEA